MTASFGGAYPTVLTGWRGLAPSFCGHAGPPTLVCGALDRSLPRPVLEKHDNASLVQKQPADKVVAHTPDRGELVDRVVPFDSSDCMATFALECVARLRLNDSVQFLRCRVQLVESSAVKMFLALTLTVVTAAATVRSQRTIASEFNSLIIPATERKRWHPFGGRGGGSSAIHPRNSRAAAAGTLTD